MSMVFGFPPPEPHPWHENPLREPLAPMRPSRRRMEVRLRGTLLEKRLQLSLALWVGEPSDPEGTCPFCGYKLTIVEILRGFTDNAHDTTTICPKCQMRFQPQLVVRMAPGQARVSFLCEAQTLARMSSLSGLDFETMKREHPDIVASARFYFGSVTAGFRRLNITFEGEPRPSWKERMIPFLGRCPDTLIAEACNVSARSVRQLRRQHGIPAFRSDSRCVN